MENKLTLIPYTDQKETALKLIQGFWIEHNDITQNMRECEEDLNAWTKEGQELYLIQCEQQIIGLAHLGARKEAIDWIEELYIEPQYQGHGYGKMALAKLEEIISLRSESAYIEVAARNMRALRLYYESGYDCLNTITIRKDFHKENYDAIRKEQLLDCELEVRRPATKDEGADEMSDEDLFKKIMAGKTFTGKKKSKAEATQQIIYRGEQEREFYLLFTKITDDYDESMMDEDVEIEEPYGVIVVAKDYEGAWIAQRNYYMGWKVIVAPIAAKYVKGYDEPHWSLIRDGKLSKLSPGTAYMIFANPDGAIISDTLCASFTLAENYEEYEKLSEEEVEKKIYDAEMGGAR